MNFIGEEGELEKIAGSVRNNKINSKENNSCGNFLQKHPYVGKTWSIAWKVGLIAAIFAEGYLAAAGDMFRTH